MNENIENNLEIEEKYMKIALQEAKKAYDSNEVPIGCVIVYNDEIIGRGANMRITDKNVLSHAEIIAINEACGFMGDWRLEDCTLYVTVEPCIMCAGAIGWAQVSTIVYGASDEKRGFSLFAPKAMHPKAVVKKGILETECAAEMISFFKKKR